MRDRSFATKHVRDAITIAACTVCLWALSTDPLHAEPANVLITLPTGAKMPQSLPGQLAAWNQSGQVSDVLWLEASQRDRPAFQSIVVLEFPGEGSYQAWMATESSKLTSPLVFSRASVLMHGELTPRDSNKSTFLVKTYDTLVPEAEYRKFVEAYLLPGMVSQRARKNLLRYTMYAHDRSPSGKGRATLVLEYRDSVAFEGRGAVDAVDEKTLAVDPAWKKYADSRDRIRKEVSETVASYTELPAPSLADLPPYKPEFKVVGSLRLVGSELKNAVDRLAEEFQKFQPDAKVTTSHTPSSEGGIAGLYMFTSDVAPMGDDAKITDMMPFYNTFGYMPTEISVATGGYEKRGSLFAWAIVVNKDNPLNEISVEELERVFGSERSGGWEAVADDYRFTAKFARGKETNIRTWSQLGLTGEFASHEIATFGYSAPGFATYFERNWFHWSKKWNSNFMEYVEAKQTSPDALGARVASNVPLEQLKSDKFAMGIAAMMHVNDCPWVKVLKISAKKGEPAVALTPENVAHRKYPLIRDAYFYVNKAPGQKLDPRVREFMRFVLSREGQEVIARVGYYYPLDPEYLKLQLKKLE